MSRHILIDLNELTILKAVDGADALKRCEYWADILIPKGEFYICGHEKRDLATFNFDELAIIYSKATDRKMRWREYRDAIMAVGELMELMKPDETDLGALVRKLGRPLKEPDFTPVKDTKKERSSAVTGIPTRPKEGTMTVRAWEAADWYYGQQEPKDIDAKELREMVVTACVENGVNKSTAGTQFGKWKRHQQMS